MFLQDESLPCTILQRDRDAKYVQTFDDVFTGEGRTVKVTPAKSPNLQAFVEHPLEGFVVGISVEDPRPSIAPVEDMVELTPDISTRRSRHRGGS